MEKSNLLVLMEEDREMLMAGIARDRSPEAAQKALEKAIDRLMLRHAEQCGDARAREAAQLVLTSIKSSLPLVDSVGEVRRWQKSAGGAAARAKPGAPAWAALIVGGALSLAALLGLSFAGGMASPLALVRSILSASAGVALVFWAGTRFAKPGRAKPIDEKDVKDEFLVDAEKLWHHLKGMLLMADATLDNLSARASAKRQRETAAESGSPIGRAQAELFAGLLENAYAQDGAGAREMIENIRFYLHGAGVEVVDYAPGRENWFELLPAQRPGTICPALVAGEKLLKKGLASA